MLSSTSVISFINVEKYYVDYSFLFSHTRFALGCGNHIRFWKDLWWGNQTMEVLYHRLYRISPKKKESFIFEIPSYFESKLS